MIAHPAVARPAERNGRADDPRSEEKIREFELEVIRATCRIPEKAKAVILLRMKEERLRQKGGGGGDLVIPIPPESPPPPPSSQGGGESPPNTNNNNNNLAITNNAPMKTFNNNLKANTLGFVNRFAGALSSVSNTHSQHFRLPSSSMIKPVVAAPAILVPR